MTEDFDVVVIGGGTAGICRANTAAIFGKRVALVEKLCEVGGSRNQHRNDPFGRTAGRFTKRSCACRDGGRDHGQRHSVPGSGSGLLGAGSSSQQRHRKQVWQCKPFHYCGGRSGGVPTDSSNERWGAWQLTCLIVWRPETGAPVNGSRG